MKSGTKKLAIFCTLAFACAGLDSSPFNFPSAAAATYQSGFTGDSFQHSPKVKLLPISFGSSRQQEALPPPKSNSLQNNGQPGTLPSTNTQQSNQGDPNQSGSSRPGSSLPGSSVIPSTALPQLGGQQEKQNNRLQNPGIVKLLKPLSVESKQRETITRRYPSGKRQLVRETVLDNSGNYVSDGRWKLYQPDGVQLMGKGQFQNGLMVGKWQRLHLERNHPWFQTLDFQGFQFPLLSSADFEKGELEGLWQISDKDQKKIVEFFFENGNRQGSWIWYFSNGKKRREIQFENGLLHGRWVEWDQQGKQTKEDWFQNGRRIYKTTSYFEQDKPETQTTFMAGKLELSEKDDWWNARLAAYNKIGADVRHGPVQSWYDNGQKHMVGYYRNGQRDGSFAWWHPNGTEKRWVSFERING